MARNKCETLTSWAQVPGSCTVVYVDELGFPNPIDFGAMLLPKIEFPEDLNTDTVSTFDYNPKNHTVNHSGVEHQLSVGKFSFNPATCQLTYEDERCNTVSYFIPQDQFVYDESGCTLTILPAKGGDPIVVPVGVPASEVGFELINNKTLMFTYKNKKCPVELPNSVIGCQYTRATNTLRMLFCDGTSVDHDIAKASMTCNTLPNGTRIWVFDDGCGNKKVIDLAPVALDIDDLDIKGSIFTWTFGGDGNQKTVTVDICDIIAENCNAHFTDIRPDGSWDFIDNAGNVYTYPAPRNCCTYHGITPTPLNPDAPPTTPVGNYPNKADGDTVIDCHPNGTSYHTCVNGAWQFDFMKLAAEEIFIGPNEPPKDGEVKNWFNPITCVVRYCHNGRWIQPTNLTCQEDEPTTEKGNATLWYKPSTCCFSILCDGVWIGVNGLVMDAVIQSLCIQVGNAAPVPLEVGRDGKVIIRIPAYPEIPDIPEQKDLCVRVGTGDLIFGEQTSDDKLRFTLPPYPEVRETCIRIGGVQAVPIVPHREGDKNFLDLPAYPIVPPPTENTDTQYNLKLADAQVASTTDGQGRICFNLPPYPEDTDTTYSFKYGDQVIEGVEQDDGTIQFAIPAPKKIINCDATIPPTDGSDGCIWPDDESGCLNILCDGVWRSYNLAVTQ